MPNTFLRGQRVVFRDRSGLRGAYQPPLGHLATIADIRGEQLFLYWDAWPQDLGYYPEPSRSYRYTRFEAISPAKELRADPVKILTQMRMRGDPLERIVPAIMKLQGKKPNPKMAKGDRVRYEPNARDRYGQHTDIPVGTEGVIARPDGNSLIGTYHYVQFEGVSGVREINGQHLMPLKVKDYHKTQLNLDGLRSRFAMLGRPATNLVHDILTMTTG